MSGGDLLLTAQVGKEQRFKSQQLTVDRDSS